MLILTHYRLNTGYLLHRYRGITTLNFYYFSIFPVFPTLFEFLMDIVIAVASVYFMLYSLRSSLLSNNCPSC